MNNKSDILKIKKFMSFVLRHKPFFYKIKLDTDGNANTDALVNAIKASLKIEISRQDLIEIAKNLSGGIFKVSKDGNLIAARHGHSFIFNMTIPAGYEECEVKSIPHQLYASISRVDFFSYINSDIIPLSNKSIILATEQPVQVAEGNMIIKINTGKLDSKKSPVYYNKESKSYFTKFITKNSVVINV